MKKWNYLNAASRIIEKKGATFYGIAVSLARITKAIFNDENAILPLSVYLDGEYGQHDVFIGVPAVINRDGIRKAIEIPLTDVEKGNLQHSADTLRKVIKDSFAELDV